MPIQDKQDKLSEAALQAINALVSGVSLLPVIQPLKLNETTASHTGTLAETIIWSALIPAGTFEENDTFEFYARVTANNTAGLKIFRAYFNSSVAIPASTSRIGRVNLTSSSAGFSSFHRHVVFKDSLSVQEVGQSSASVLTDYSVSTTSVDTLGIDFSVDQYLIFTGELAVTSDTMAIRSVNSKILR